MHFNVGSSTYVIEIIFLFSQYSSPPNKSRRDEIDKLMNSDSPMDETCQTMIEMNDHDRDHEGGDSGYCDRNHSQSPQLNYNKRQRKCSDITMDDGFYENEVQSVNGTSPV